MLYRISCRHGIAEISPDKNISSSGLNNKNVSIQKVNKLVGVEYQETPKTTQNTIKGYNCFETIFIKAILK